MKTKLNPPGQAASALMVSLFLIAILAFSITGYLTYVGQQCKLGMRSQTWNSVLAIAEAGIEEGLQALNQDPFPTGMTSGDWVADGSVYTLSRTFDDGSVYWITNDCTSTNLPVTTSRGYTYARLAGNVSPTFFAAVGLPASQSQITRGVRVEARRGSLFQAGVITKKTVDCNGNNVLTDSYDSSNPGKSNNGRYDPSKYTGDHGDVASNAGINNAVDVGNANIHGHVYVGANGSVKIGSQGMIGSHAWESNNPTGIESDYVSDTANYTFPDASLPTGYASFEVPVLKTNEIVTIGGTNIISTNYMNMPNPPGPLVPPWTTRGEITTNTTTVYTNDYPGPIPGLVTNSSMWVTVSNWPGNKPGLSTNCVAYTTSSNYPGPQLCISTNCDGTLTKQKTYPSSWCGAAPYQKGVDINWWYFYKIASYTYANVFTYTYLIYTYAYPTYNYTYTEYQGIPVYVTNLFYGYLLEDGHRYVMNSEFQEKILVIGKATLVMPNNNLNSDNPVIITNTGSALSFYTGETSVNFSGNAVINSNGNAESLIYYAPNATDFQLTGNGTFTGVLVAPKADVKLAGGGSDTEDFMGCIMADSVQLNGHFNFHFDEALRNILGNGRFLIFSWKEIP